MLRQVARIVTSLGHDLSTENIGFSFILATELQQVDRKWRLGKLAHAWTTEDRSGNPGNACKQTVLLPFGSLRGTMPQSHVS